MSLYLRNPGVPAVRIGAYPKRRASGYLPLAPASAAASASAASDPARRPDPCYADFLRVTEAEHVSAERLAAARAAAAERVPGPAEGHGAPDERGAVSAQRGVGRAPRQVA